MSFSTPVLLLLFNRPDVTETVFAEIRKIKPLQLFVVADGPRPDRPDETEKCIAARKIVTDNIDWECEVKTLFRDENLGCGKGVSAAITWFFEHVEEGIILEDDCLPIADFFTFCQAMLERYRDNNMIMHIGGSNFQDRKVTNCSYYFSSYIHIWGWATWRRAWQNYSFDISLPDEHLLQDMLKKRFSNQYERAYWESSFRAMANHNIDTWDVQWVYYIYKQLAMGITPVKNLVINIGFRDDATHTKSSDPVVSGMQLQALGQLRHPNKIRILKRADNYSYKKLFQFGNTRFNRFKFRVGQRFPIIKSTYLKLVEKSNDDGQ